MTPHGVDEDLEGCANPLRDVKKLKAPYGRETQSSDESLRAVAVEHRTLAVQASVMRHWGTLAERPSIHQDTTRAGLPRLEALCFGLCFTWVLRIVG